MPKNKGGVRYFIVYVLLLGLEPFYKYSYEL